MKQIMKRAWQLAFEGQRVFGGKVKEYFAASLVIAWEESKTTVKVDTFKVEAVKSWFVEKNFNDNEAYAIRSECDCIEVIAETEKAVRVIFHTAYGKIWSWVPKSAVATKEEIVAEGERLANAWENGLKRNQILLEEAKRLGIKGLRARNTTATLQKKIAARKLELGIS